MLVVCFAGLLGIVLIVFVASVPSFAGPLWTPTRLLIAIFLPSVIAIRSRRRRTLSTSGCIAAIITGAAITTCSYVHVCTLLAFYIPSVIFSKWKKNAKRDLAVDDHGVVEGRQWSQVLANGGVATAACLCAMMEAGAMGLERPVAFTSATYWSSWFDFLFLGSLAFAAGDTWASELGMIVVSRPILITTLRKVPPGTNGAVSLPGLLFSLLGGCFVGCAHYVAVLVWTRAVILDSAPCQHNLILVGAVAGLFGSILDSTLGALFQYSGYDTATKRVVPSSHRNSVNVVHISGIDLLSNDGVNLLSALFTGILTYGLAEIVWSHTTGCIN